MDKFGFSEREWNESKKEAAKAMIHRARVRGTIPYSEIVNHIHAARLEAHDVRLWHLLGEISEEEDAAGRGMLSVIVVHKMGDMQPGPGFFELAGRLGRYTSDILACWVNELKKVHAYWSQQSSSAR